MHRTHEKEGLARNFAGWNGVLKDRWAQQKPSDLSETGFKFPWLSRGFGLESGYRATTN